MKVRIEIDDSAEEEVVIRCRKLTDSVIALQKYAESGTECGCVLTLNSGGREYFVPSDDIFRFESFCGKTYAFTKNEEYTTTLRLYELSDILPSRFIRVSKSCLLNTDTVTSISRSATGVCEAQLSSGDVVYISRMYYKPFREQLNERYGGK